MFLDEGLWETNVYFDVYVKYWKDVNWYTFMSFDMFYEKLFMKGIFQKKNFLQPHQVFWLMFLSFLFQTLSVKPSKEGVKSCLTRKLPDVLLYSLSVELS